jgi:hypothetical protein
MLAFAMVTSCINISGFTFLLDCNLYGFLWNWSVYYRLFFPEVVWYHLMKFFHSKTPQVSAIKSGMWNSIYDTFQVFNHSELTNSPTKSSEFETIDVGPSLENVPLVTKDSTENTKCESICLLNQALSNIFIY